MNKLSVMAAMAITALCMTGCSTMNQMAPSAPISAQTVATFEPNVTIGEKIKGEAFGLNLFGIWVGPSEFADGVTYNTGSTFKWTLGPVAQVKAAAALDAVKAGKADIIVAPTYRIKQSDYLFFGTIDVTVEGYKGTIDGIKQIPPLR